MIRQHRAIATNLWRGPGRAGAPLRRQELGASLRRDRGREDSPRATEGSKRRPRIGGERWASPHAGGAPGAGF
jgi:hypothetical protein